MLMIKTCKKLLFTDIEFLNLTIYLKKIGWTYKNLEFESYLLILGLAIKVRYLQIIKWSGTY